MTNLYDNIEKFMKALKILKMPERLYSVSWFYRFSVAPFVVVFKVSHRKLSS